jgi:predicted ABC-type transport system involved in lysophospholipase L1 biosynthesis ATPase subunit
VSLLSLEHVTARPRSERHERAALRDVSLDIEAGELVAIAGPPRSGRTTLVRIAAGIVSPSAGAVRFGGADLARRPMIGAPNGIAYAITSFEPIVGGCVLEQVAAPMLARGCSMLRARAMAYSRLRRAGVAACASLGALDLSCVEALRVAIARALMTAPALLLLDDPADVSPSREHGELLTLLRAIAHHDAIAVVLTTDPCSVPGDVDRAYRLERGALRRLPEPARVVPLRPPPGWAR